MKNRQEVLDYFSDKPATVGALIQKLQEFDPSAIVTTSWEGTIHPVVLKHIGLYCESVVDIDAETS